LERLKRESRIRKRVRICIRWGAIEGGFGHGHAWKHFPKRIESPLLFCCFFTVFATEPSLPFPKKMVGVCVCIALHGINWI